MRHSFRDIADDERSVASHRAVGSDARRTRLVVPPQALWRWSQWEGLNLHPGLPSTSCVALLGVLTIPEWMLDERDSMLSALGRDVL